MRPSISTICRRRISPAASPTRNRRLSRQHLRQAGAAGSAPDRKPFYAPHSADIFAAATAPLWTTLEALHPHLWKQGKQFPANSTLMRQMLADGELAISLTFNPNEVANEIAAKRLPESVVRTSMLAAPSATRTSSPSRSTPAPRKARRSSPTSCCHRRRRRARPTSSTGATRRCWRSRNSRPPTVRCLPPAPRPANWREAHRRCLSRTARGSIRSSASGPALRAVSGAQPRRWLAPPRLRRCRCGGAVAGASARAACAGRRSARRPASRRVGC